MEQEERKLPVIDIAGAGFYVDAIHMVLIDTNDKDNIIHMMELLDVGDHFEMLFDKVTRNVKNDWRIWDNDRYEYVWIRPFEVYDIEGARMRFGHESKLISKELPVIDVDGVKFLWDKQHTRLLQQDNTFNHINKNDMQSNKGIIGFYFDRRRKVVPFPHEVEALKVNGKLPSHIRFVPTSEITEKVRKAKKAVDRASPRNKGIKLR